MEYLAQSWSLEVVTTQACVPGVCLAARRKVCELSVKSHLVSVCKAGLCVNQTSRKTPKKFCVLKQNIRARSKGTDGKRKENAPTEVSRTLAMLASFSRGRGFALTSDLRLLFENNSKRPLESVMNGFQPSQQSSVRNGKREAEQKAHDGKGTFTPNFTSHGRQLESLFLTWKDACVVRLRMHEIDRCENECFHWDDISPRTCKVFLCD